jgi:type IV pilus assembly protein PilQ
MFTQQQSINNFQSRNKIMFKRLISGGIAIIALLSQGAMAAGAKLNDISFSSLPGGQVELRMAFDGTPPEPTDYIIDKPARIVLDFNDVENGLKEKKFPLPFPNVSSVVVLGGEDRTRVILNMTSVDKFEASVDGSSYVLTVGSNKVSTPFAKSDTISSRLSGEELAASTSVTNIDFRRGEAGEGNLIVSLSDSSVNVNLEEKADGIEVTFRDTMLPSELRRKLDVTDFATPVLAINSSYDAGNTRIFVKPQGDYDQLAYQTDDQYIISIKPLTKKELEEKRSKFNYIGEKLSLNFQNIPVRSVLQIIADFTELNLVASDTVTGTITLRLEDVPWDQALELVLKTKGLDKRQVGNVLMVAPADEIAEQERAQIENQRQLEELAPLRTEYLQILYANAADIMGILESGDEAGGFVSERGSVIFDERTNSIIMTDTEAKIVQAREIISRLDAPVKQVSVESRLVRASTNFSKNLGVNWGFGTGNITNNGHNAVYSTGGQTAGINIANNLYSNLSNGDITPSDINSGVDFGSGGGSSQGNVVDLRAGGNPAQITFGILDKRLNFLTLELTAMESSGEGEIISQPTVVTQNGTTAEISSGSRIPFQEATSSGATSTSFQDAVLGLEVTPFITPDNQVLMEVSIEKDAIGSITVDAGPVIDTTEIETSLLVGNGETAVIGGIYEEATAKALDKVPFFGDLPLLGKLFRRTTTNSNKVELLIFLTPRVLSDPLARN